MSTEYESNNELTVNTDLHDYAPGETAVITASNVEIGGTVEFQVEHVDDAGADGVMGTADDVTVDLGGAGHESWSVTDGGSGDLDGVVNGVIVTDWYVNPDDSLNETFLLSASDGTSTAYSSFTDGASYDLDQWANGADTGHLDNDGDGWQNGNLNENQAHYYQGDYVPYRAIQTDLTQGTYFLTIEYDTTEGGEHSIDYLGSYDASFGTGETHDGDLMPDPTDGTGLDSTADSTLQVVTDPDVANAGVTQETGEFSMFDGTLLGYATAGGDGVFGNDDDTYYLAGADGEWGTGDEAIVNGWTDYSTGNYTLNQTVTSATVGDAVYNPSGDYSGNSQQSITVMYEYSGTNGEDAVLAWGGHIATNEDWDNEANPSGSPYHMRLIDLAGKDANGDDIQVTGAGNQDRSLSRTAIVNDPSLSIDKVVTDVGGDGPGGTADEAGDIITYKLVVTNTGNQTLTNVMVEDPLTGTDHGPVSLEPGEILTLDNLTYEVTQADIDTNGGGDGDIDNTATADSDETDPTDDSAEVPIAYAGIEIHKLIKANGEWYDADGDADMLKLLATEGKLEYKIIVENTGNVDLTGVKVWDPNLGIPEWCAIDVGTIEVGKDFTLTAQEYSKLEVCWSEGEEINIAYADSDQTDEVSDEANYFGAVVCLDVDKVTIDECDNEGDDLVVRAGSPIQWQYTVTNNGNVDIALKDLVMYDDNGTWDKGDDWNLTNFTNKGDGDDVLNAGETWVFVETGTAITGDEGKCDTDGSYSNYAIVSVDYADTTGLTKTFTALDISSYTLEGYGDDPKGDDGHDGAGQDGDVCDPDGHDGDDVPKDDESPKGDDGQPGDACHYEGGGEDDKFVGCKDDEWFYGNSGNDYIKGRGGNDYIVGNRGRDEGFGGKGADILLGGHGKDRLKGGDGKDHVEGGLHNDKVWGGAGCDTFKFGDGDGKDRVMDFDATGRKHDIIDLCDVSDIGGWKDLKNNHVEEVDRGVWIHSENVEIFLKGVEWADLDKGDFCL